MGKPLLNWLNSDWLIMVYNVIIIYFMVMIFYDESLFLFSMKTGFSFIVTLSEFLTVI